MEYQTYSKNILVTESLQEYLDMKLKDMDELGLDIISCRVDLSRDEHHRKGEVYRVEVNVNVPGKLLRIVEQHSDIRAAVDLVSEKLTLQLKKHKSKQVTKERRLGRVFKRFWKKS